MSVFQIDLSHVQNLPENVIGVEFRPPIENELFVDLDGAVCVSRRYGVVSPRLVIKLWHWPDWVKPGTWYCRDDNGNEYLSAEEPHLKRGDGEWDTCDRMPVAIEDVIEVMTVDWTPPPEKPWRESKMQKPLEAK